MGTILGNGKMLNTLTTKNFKKLGNSTFRFTDGLNIVCGDNAQGKTTLTQAIMFALFGVKAVPGNSGHIKTWGADGKVEVTLSIGAWQITRDIKNCTVSELKNGEYSLVATGNTDAGRYIEEHITGTDLKGFKMLNWSEQGETAGLLTIGAPQLQRDVEKFSGVEFIDEMIKLAGSDYRDLTRESDLHESKGTVKQLTSQVNEIESSLERVAEGISAMRDKLAVLKKGKTAIESKLTEAEDTNRKAVKQAKAITELESELYYARESVAGLIEERGRLKGELKQLPESSEEQLSGLRQCLKEMSNRHTQHFSNQSKHDDILVRLNGIDEHIAEDDKLTEAVELARAEVDSIAPSLNEAKSLGDQLRSQIQSLKAAISSGVCEACGQLIESEEQIEKHKQELAEIEKTSLEVAERYKGLKVKSGLAQGKLTDAKLVNKAGFGGWKQIKLSLTKQLEEVNIELEESKEQVEEELKSNALENLQAEIETASSALSSRDSLQASLDRCVKKLTSREQEISGTEESLTELKSTLTDPVSDKEIESMKAEIRQLHTDLDATVDSQHAAELAQSAAEYELRDAKASLKSEKAIQAVREEAKKLNDFSQYLKDSRVRFLSSIWANILAVASDFLIHATKGQITALSRSDKEGFLFCENGVYAPISAASGAQKGFIGVAIRLAMAKVLRSSCPIVVLDEPTEAMSEENAMRLSGSLLGHGQVLMITHRESDRAVASNVIRV